MDHELRITALERLCDEQAARIADLERLLVADYRAPVEWGLPRREQQIFGMLIARPRVTKEQIITLFYADDEGGPNAVESHVSKMRKRLARFGVTIESERYLGYRLLDRSRFAVVPA